MKSLHLIAAFVLVAMIPLVAPAACLSALGPYTDGAFDYYVLRADITGLTVDAIDFNATSAGAVFVGENLTFVLENVSNPPGTFNPNTDVLGQNTTFLGMTVIVSQDTPSQLQGSIATLGFDINDLGITTINFLQLVVPVGYVPVTLPLACGMTDKSTT